MRKGLLVLSVVERRPLSAPPTCSPYLQQMVSRIRPVQLCGGLSTPHLHRLPKRAAPSARKARQMIFDLSSLALGPKTHLDDFVKPVPKFQARPPVHYPGAWVDKGSMFYPVNLLVSGHWRSFGAFRLQRRDSIHVLSQISHAGLQQQPEDRAGTGDCSADAAERRCPAASNFVSFALNK
ncbi:hypothetical protein GQ43DRAFT_118760 [Delitschia confertaspora ATCC 74209]|uniref:Uncharacterized protein n=1 Tax=Delitschia confertaspora ATCC 74209 TaxID=1513339 RepID=A0A9P4JJQ4_9PLEO|nr:hypothetical protein GQ43DRAFT_118760 [Delitschia confertaspora ATCC 74209]